MHCVFFLVACTDGTGKKKKRETNNLKGNLSLIIIYSLVTFIFAFKWQKYLYYSIGYT